MFKKIKISYFFLFLTAILFSCAGASNAVRAPGFDNNNPASQLQKIPDFQDIEGQGVASDFSQAKNMAYEDVVRKGVLVILDQKSYNDNAKLIQDNILGSIIKLNGYVADKKWLGNPSRNAKGDLVVKINAKVNLKKLKADLDALLPTQTVSNPNSNNSSSEQKIEDTTLQTVNDPKNSPVEDLSNIDISSLSVLIFYNSSDPDIPNDPEQIKYSKSAVNQLNSELIKMQIETFDLETSEKLAQEKELLHQEMSGSAGIGLILAGKVYAELYGEVTPMVQYEGNQAHVILNFKIFVRTGAKLIESIQKGGQAFDSISLNASIAASMKDAVRKMMPDINLALKRYVNKGRFYTIRLGKIDSVRTATAFSSTVGKIDGVNQVKQLSYSRNDQVADYQIQFKGTPNDLVEKIIDTLGSKAGFEKFDLENLRGNELIFTVN